MSHTITKSEQTSLNYEESKSEEKISEGKKQESKTANNNTAIEKPRENIKLTPDEIRALENRERKERPEVTFQRGLSKIVLKDNKSENCKFITIQSGPNDKLLDEEGNLHNESIIKKEQKNDGESMGIIKTSYDTNINCVREVIMDGEGVIDEFDVQDRGGSVKREQNTRKKKDESEPEEQKRKQDEEHVKNPEENNVPEFRGGPFAGQKIPIKKSNEDN